MRVQFVIPVIASVLILGVLGTAEDAFAPKKLFVGGLSWDAETQSFEVTGKINYGLAKAIENTSFHLQGSLRISVDDVVLDFHDGLELGPSFEPAENGFSVFFVNIPWERLGGTFEETADVTIELQILNPAGKPVAIAEPLTVTIDIGPPPEICDGTCSEISSGCCEERADCAWYNGDAGFCGIADEPPCRELNEEWCNEFPDACVWTESEECTFAEEPTACKTNSDCAEGEFCFNDVCFSEPACTGDADCAEGEFCDAGFCQSLECMSNEDCSEGFVCESNRCVLSYTELSE